MTEAGKGVLAGRIAIITGAASGQGRAVALAFAAEGARLALCDVNADGLSETQAMVADVGSDPFIASFCLRSVPAIERFVADTAAHFGGIDIVYNNAAISISKAIEEVDEAFWDLTQEVNLKAQFFMTRYALPHLRKSASPTIINVSSMAGQFGVDRSSAYCASKGGVNQLTKAMAVELAGAGIRVNGISPGLVATPMIEDALAHHSPEERARIISGWAGRQLFKRAGQPEEIASVALFLASDQASFLTGEIINAAGGWAAG